MEGIGRRRQRKIFTGGMVGESPRVPVGVDALELAGLARMNADGRAYFAGGAGTERTMAANRNAFDRHRLVPRMLCGVAERDLSVELFGRRLPLPFLLGPIGVLELAHRGADPAAARAAARHGIPFVTSTQASRSLETIADAIGDAPRWFQLYWSSSDELTASLVSRAERAGYEAIVLTLDTTQLGWRPRDLDRHYLPFLRGRGIANYLSDPVFRELPAVESEPQARRALRPGAWRSILELLRYWPEGARQALQTEQTRALIARFIALYSRPDLSWEDLPFLRERTRLPILLKGILHPDDARRALDAGADGIVVSNHGGRQVDGAIGALDALPGVVEAVNERVPVLFDSGIRTGADVVKALCLGARAVLIARPYAYGLALAGEAGVAEVIENLAADLDLTMALAGRGSVAELDRSMIVPAP